MTTISTPNNLRYSDFYGMMNYAEFLQFEAEVKAGSRSLSDKFDVTISETTWV
jgi:hypothetical protein